MYVLSDSYQLDIYFRTMHRKYCTGRESLNNYSLLCKSVYNLPLLVIFKYKHVIKNLDKHINHFDPCL